MMQNRKIIYQNLPIIKWFFVLATLFSFGGYSQDTSTKMKEVVTELLVVTEERTDKTFHFKRALQSKTVTKHFYYCYIPELKLSNLHSELTFIFFKNFTPSVSLLFRRKTMLIHLPKFPREASFLV